MISLNGMLEIGKSGLLANKGLLAVTGQNVSNVNTAGYHRQRVKLETQPPLSTVGSSAQYSFGTGVKIADIVRDYNMLLENMLRDQTSASSAHGQLGEALKNAEALMAGDTDTNFSVQLQQFWSAWQDLSAHPESLTYRNVLLQKTAALTGQMNALAGRVTQYRGEILTGVGAGATGAIARDVIEINDFATRIADLNDKIRRLSAWGNTNPNDLFDARDQLVHELAEKTNLTLTREADGSYTLEIDGQTLVTGSTANAMSITGDNPIALELNGVAITPTGGTLAGWISAAGMYDTLGTDLDALANELVVQINALHSTGYDLQGATGANFFDPAGLTAATIALDPALLGQPGLISAAATLHDPGPPVVPNVGDGAMALAIAELSAQGMAALNNQTYNEYFTGLWTQLGTNIKTEADLSNEGNAVVTMLRSAIQSETGVNLDEEMTIMLGAQRAFEASAKIITTVDGMMDTVINQMA